MPGLRDEHALEAALARPLQRRAYHADADLAEREQGAGSVVVLFPDAQLVEDRVVLVDPAVAVAVTDRRQIGKPVAAALNGIKGWNVSLNERRGWKGDALDAALEKSTKQGLLTRKALDALIGAMEDALPHWRRYLALAPEGEWIELAREFSEQ